MFIVRTTQDPTLQQLLELERILAIDGAGVNQPVGPGRVNACVVGETLQGPFTPTVVVAPSDITSYYVGNQNQNSFTLISQSGIDPTSAVQDGSGAAFDGNLWAELKGKTISGLVIQRVDTDMVVATPSTVKAFVAFTLTVNAADLTAGKTNKDIVIPSGTRFADNAIGTATVVVATSQQIIIPTGTTCGGSLSCAFSFTQDQASGALTYVTTGATTGATCFFVKGTTLAIAGLDTVIDGIAASNPLPGVNAGTVIASSGVSTINASAAATAIFAPCGGGSAPSPDTLSNRITACYASAIDKTLPGVDATQDIVAIWSARNYQTSVTGAATALRNKLWTNAVASSRVGRGRVACVTAAPALGITSSAATTAKGVYEGLISGDGITGDDADRFWLSGPYMQVFSAELNANIQISVCGFRAAMKVNLANAGKSQYQTSVGSPENTNIQAVNAQEICFAANPLIEDDFVAMRAKGVAWFTKDRTAGWWFYSGVTGANQLTAQNRMFDNRRSFADEVQDVIFGTAAPYSKKPGTAERADAFATDMEVYLQALVKPPVGESRAKDYIVQDGPAAGNTDYLNGHGVYLWNAFVQMYGDMNAMVIKTMIGPNVIIAQVAAA